MGLAPRPISANYIAAMMAAPRTPRADRSFEYDSTAGYRIVADGPLAWWQIQCLDAWATSGSSSWFPDGVTSAEVHRYIDAIAEIRVRVCPNATPLEREGGYRVPATVACDTVSFEHRVAVDPITGVKDVACIHTTQVVHLPANVVAMLADSFAGHELRNPSGMLRWLLQRRDGEGRRICWPPDKDHDRFNVAGYSIARSELLADLFHVQARGLQRHAERRELNWVSASEPIVPVSTRPFLRERRYLFGFIPCGWRDATRSRPVKT